MVILASWRNAASIVLQVSFALVVSASPSDIAAAGDEASEPVLEIVNCDLLDSRDGFAIPEDTQFLPGERVHLICQVQGYRVGREDRVHVSYEVTGLDPRARSFYPPHQGRYDTELAPQDENWLPILRYSPLIPDHANGGTFVLRVSVTDHIGGAAVSTDVPVRVDAPQFDLTDGLTIRSFHVRSHPSDLPPWESYSVAQRDPAETRSHHPGDEVPVSFLITGFAVRNDNAFDVESQAWLVDADGEELLDLGVTRESGRPYYPRLWIPGDILIRLDPSIPPGEYRIKVRLHDRFARIERVHEFPLRVSQGR